MHFSFRPASPEDAEELAALHTAVAEHLTSQYGPGPWSNKTTARGVLCTMRAAQVFAARKDSAIVGTLALTTKKPWAIDTSYFNACRAPIYLIGMAVTPPRQCQGIGRRCLEAAQSAARAWRADAIRLDAFDADAGAGGFYARCGFTEVGRATYRDTPLIYYELILRGPHS
jgi:GNAT superfamily N-acetyltransferase